MNKKLKFAYVSILVIFAFFVVLRIVPIMMTFFLSFHKWSLINPAKPFVGLQNYQHLFSDSSFHSALSNTLLFAGLGVVIVIILALLLAVILERPLRFGAFFETILFLPIVIPMVPVSLVWKWIYDPTYGSLNYMLKTFGLPPQGWLTNEHLAIFSILFVVIWQRIGYNMVILLVALRGLPKQLLEAAQIDGASGWRLFRLIKLPLIKPIIFYLIVMNSIELLRVFTPVYVMTFGSQAAPSSAVKVLAFDIYQNAFRFFKAGYASAEAMVLFVLILIISLLQFKVLRGGTYD